MKQRDHGTLRGEVSTITLHMEQKQEKERLARERVENLEVSKGRERPTWSVNSLVVLLGVRTGWHQSRSMCCQLA